MRERRRERDRGRGMEGQELMDSEKEGGRRGVCVVGPQGPSSVSVGRWRKGLNDTRTDKYIYKYADLDSPTFVA